MADKPNFSGIWNCYKSEQFEEALKAAGASLPARKVGGNVNPSCEVHQDGDSFVFKLKMLVFTREEKCIVGQETEVEQLDGNKYKAIASWEGNKLVLKCTPKESGKGKDQSISREINSDGDLVMSIQVGDVVGKRYFKKKE